MAEVTSCCLRLLISGQQRPCVNLLTALTQDYTQQLSHQHTKVQVPVSLRGSGPHITTDMDVSFDPTRCPRPCTPEPYELLREEPRDQREEPGDQREAAKCLKVPVGLTDIRPQSSRRCSSFTAQLLHQLTEASYSCPQTVCPQTASLQWTGGAQRGFD